MSALIIPSVFIFSKLNPFAMICVPISMSISLFSNLFIESIFSIFVISESILAIFAFGKNFLVLFQQAEFHKFCI